MTEKQYPKLPAPDTHCFDEDTGKDVWSHSAGQLRAYVDADRAMRAAQAAPAAPASLDAEDALVAALERAYFWMDAQADTQSKGCHATFDLMMLREERDAAKAAIDAAMKKKKPMNTYIVILLYPDYIASDYGEDYYFWKGKAESPTDAARKAQQFLASEHNNEPEDFYVVVVIGGVPRLHFPLA